MVNYSNLPRKENILPLLEGVDTEAPLAPIRVDIIGHPVIRMTATRMTVIGVGNIRMGAIRMGAIRMGAIRIEDT